MNQPIPILLYHRIEDSDLSTATPPQVFRSHLRKLREEGWTSLSSEEFGYLMSTGRAAPERSFLITFDDGYASVATEAEGILREFGFTATLFVSTKFVRDPEALPDPADANAASFLDWDQVRRLQSNGIIDCQSHTHSHRNFHECTETELRHDLIRSIDILASELDLPRSHFSHLAWPWGLSTPAWRALACGCGFRFQYTVARQAFRLDAPVDEIPRTCFDATGFSAFQRQLWLQTGQLAALWDIAYPMGRSLRRIAGMLR